MATAIPTSDEIRKQAESLYNPAYEASLASLVSSATAATTAKDRSVADLQNTLVKTLDDTKRSIDNSLIQRGMGRSSRAAYEVTEGLADVNAAANTSLTRLLEDYAANINNIEGQKGQLSANYQQNVNAGMLNLMQYYEGIRQFDEQLALQYAQLNKSYGSGGGGLSASALSAESIYGDTGSTETNGSVKTTAGMPDYIMNSKVLSDAAPQAAGYTGARNGAYYIRGRQVSRNEYLKFSTANNQKWTGSLGGRSVSN